MKSLLLPTLLPKHGNRFATDTKKRPAAPLNRTEAALAFALLLALLVACFGPFVAQPVHYHAFADQRGWLGLPFAMDVLSNVPFAVGGLWGLWLLRQMAGPDNAGDATHAAASVHGRSTNHLAQKPLAALFFIGLIVTAICSSIYHWQPANPSLAIDRAGMVVAFAGLLGLACADRLSARAGWAVAALVLLAGPVSVLVWSHTGNLLPWVVLQGGGMVLLLLMALKRPLAGAWGINLGLVIGLYGLAKVLELGDHGVFDLTQGLVSGHTLKHVVAALAAWPVIRAIAKSGKPG